MKNKEYVKNLAMFMISLVLLLPIHSAGALAATTVNSVDVYGQHHVKGIRAQTDLTIVNVSVSSTDDPSIEGHQVKILEDPTRPFECSPEAEGSSITHCIHEYPETTVPDNYGILSFTVQVFNDGGTPMSPPKPASVLIDARGPELLEPVDYSLLPGGVLAAGFRASDYSCEKSECDTRCAGIRSVKFTLAGTVLGQATDFDDLCEQTGRVNLTGVIVGGDVAEKQICIELEDKLGQAETECSDVFVDAKAPEITGVGMYDVNGRPIRFTNGDPLNSVSLVINITEHSGLFHPDTGAENSIKVNASTLSDRPDQQAAYGNLALNCDPVPSAENAYTCEKTGLFFIMSEARTVSVIVKAEDGYENVANEQKTLQVGFDNTPPVATALRTPYFNDLGNFYVGEERNTIFLDVSEDGAGLANRYVFLDFSGFGAQDMYGSGTNLVPNSCDTGWICQWNNIKVTGRASGTALPLSVQPGSKDDAGNPFNPFTAQLLVDIDEPEVTDDLIEISNITGIGELHDASTDLVSGDMIEVHLFVEDRSGIKTAVANLSEIVEGGDEAAPGTCEENQAAISDNRIYECVWEAGPIVTGYLGSLGDAGPSIYFTFEDYVNHTGEYEWEDIEILAAENETGVSWVADVSDPSPELGLDRLTWTLSEPRIYYQLTLDGASGRDPIPLSVELDAQTCSGLEYVSVDTLTNDVAISLLDFPVYSLRPEPPFTDVVEIRMNPEAVPELETYGDDNTTVPLEGFFINCSLYITSIVTTYEEGAERAMTLPEEVNISFWVPVYNNPLGSNIGNVNDYVQKMIDDSKSWEWLTLLRQIFDVAQQVCHLIETLMRVNTLWASIKDVFGGLCGAQGYSCGTSAQIGETEGFLTGAVGRFIDKLYDFCGLFISCKVSSKPDEDCTEGRWCAVQNTWGRITSFYANIMNKITLGSLATATQFGDTGTSLFGSVTDCGGSGDSFSGGERFETTGLGDASDGKCFDSSSFDPKKSIFSSALSLCIPGLILNGEKFRQIHCKKILCYRIDVANGRPAWRCDQEYNYLVCTHLVGQAFAAIPIVQFIDEIGSLMEGIFRNPWGLLGWAVDKTCDIICKTSAGVGCSVCRGILLIPAIINIGADLVESTGPRFEMAMFDMCEQATAELPDYTEVEPPTPPTGVIN